MTIGALNKRLASLQKVLSKESYKKVVGNLNLPSSDFVTKVVVSVQVKNYGVRLVVKSVKR